MISHSVISKWDLRLAKTHSAWLQDLMKLRFLMSHCKNSVGDTVIGKRWICSDSERSTLQERGPSQREAAMEYGVVSFRGLGDFIC